MKKILLIFGTRPEALKIFPVYKKLIQDPGNFQTYVCNTGQHKEMLDQILKLYDIKVDFNLNVMLDGQDLFDITSSVLIGLRSVIVENKPDIILVHGDTTTTFAGALAGFYLNIPVGHIEAGLRTHNPRSPFPEEINRQFVSRLATYHFCPTDESYKNLLEEGLHKNQMIVTGNTVIDTLLWSLRNIDGDNTRKQKLIDKVSNELGINIERQKFVLITGHRRENHGEGIIEICNAIDCLANNNPNVHFVYPVHLNPKIKNIVFEKLSFKKNIHLCKPLEYEEFIVLMKYCFFVMTDSGGIQEEAPSLGKPVLLMRNTTERPEGVRAGCVKLVGTNAETIIAEATNLLTDDKIYKNMSSIQNPFGTGAASERIINFIREL